MASTPPKLEKRIGLSQAVLSGLGVTVGAGIYVLIGAGAGSAGNAVWLSFVIAAVISSFTALSYARLARFKPVNAPEFHYVKLAFNQRLGFLAGWLILWSMVVSAAVVSLGFAGYLQQFIDLPAAAIAAALVGVSTLIILIGTRQSMALMGILTAVTVFGLVAVIVIGVPHLGSADLLEAPQGLSGVFSAAALVFFAFLGFETMANLSGEMKNPGRDLPKAMLLVLAVSAVFYVLVALAAVNVLGWEALSSSSAPMTDVFRLGLGASSAGVITIISMAATGSTAFFLLLSASRAVWEMSCYGVLPLPFCTIGQRRTPWVAIAGVGLFSVIFILIRNIETVALFTNIAVLLAFTGINAAAIRLSKSLGKAANSKPRAWERIAPALGIAACLWLAWNTGTAAMLFGGLLVAVGLVYYQAFVARTSNSWPDRDESPL
ncbi:APC family permease [Dehalogenimonas sp. 4OHTPN]|uniref:APC family permease n=1 Tax=Dehalogenimonas sp. 4OHTPN TaxID=3166643 RepID=A0AAU8GBA6_9CHLR